MAVERVLSNLNLISFKTEGGLQNHIDELQDGDLVFTPDNSLKGNLFDFKWTDHKLNDISWLNADTFSWQSGDVYVAAYEHLANDYNSLSTGVLYAWSYSGDTYYTQTPAPVKNDPLFNADGTRATPLGVETNIARTGTDEDGEWISYMYPDNQFWRDASKDIALSTPVSATETISGITITYYKAEDGHKICLADQEANVQALYDSTGIAWYYILDTENKQFKLPRTKFGFTGFRDTVGGYVEAGLPNITGTINNAMFLGNNGDAVPTGTGAFKVNSYNKQALYQGNESNRTDSWAFDASRSNTTYGNSDTVQPKATQMYLYFYVGNFEQSALEQTAGITSEQLNNKLDKSAETYLVPSGSVTAFAGSTAPAGWLKCDGSAISRTTYAALFNVIGTIYGAGDGSTTFNLPNLQVGRVPVGMDGAYVGQSTKGVLPNITAYWGSTIAQDQSYGGAVVQDTPYNTAWWYGATAVPRGARFSFDAQRVNAIYGSGWFDGTKVIPASVGMTYCIKY